MDGYNFSCVNVNPLFGLAAGKFLKALETTRWPVSLMAAAVS